MSPLLLRFVYGQEVCQHVKKLQPKEMHRHTDKTKKHYLAEYYGDSHTQQFETLTVGSFFCQKSTYRETIAATEANNRVFRKFN